MNWTPKLDAALRRLVADGLTDRAIARELGISHAPWRVCERRHQLGLIKRAAAHGGRDRYVIQTSGRSANPGRILRPCLNCRRKFNSEGPHNRLCGNCRNETDTVFTRPAAVIR